MQKIELNEPREVSPEVDAFMKKYGGNHITWTNGGRKEPQMMESRDLLLQQFTWAVNNGRRGQMLDRIAGRYRKVREKEEIAWVKTVATPDLGALG